MIEEGLLLPMNVLLQGQKLTLLDPEMWFLRGNENKDVTIFGNDSNLLIVFYVQIMPDDFVMQLH
ncbi:putative type III secretion apparatus regulatory domain protein, partial [Escherichia coli 3006]